MFCLIEGSGCESRRPKNIRIRLIWIRNTAFGAKIFFLRTYLNVQTFNQPWTDSEQKRLEELLETHPSQEVEMDRWKKIAEQLGNRNPIQASFAFNTLDQLYSTGTEICWC
jgi:hypothetical protein